ncbi:hypothetical protein AAHC03_024204 [Spirometra sp. Aus1]
MKSTAALNLPTFSPLEHAIAEKRSELRVYRDLLFQQICDLKKNLDERENDTQLKSKDVEETTENLKATCDTFLATSDELIRLLTSNGPSSQTAASAVAKRTKQSSGASTTDGPQFLPDARTRKPLIPSNLQTAPAQFNGNSLPSGQDVRPEPGDDHTPTAPVGAKTTKSERKISSRKSSVNDDGAAGRLTNGTLLNAHLRSLRLTRPFQTFFSVMEFSFEDIPPAVTSDRLKAVEFLASSRSLLKFFNILATTDEAGQPVLSRLGSLQTVYADVMGNIVRLELAVSTLCEEKKSIFSRVSNGSSRKSSTGSVKNQPSNVSTANLKSLEISLQDIISAESQAGRCRNIGSAYFAMLWLCRALNFATDFISGLFADYTTAGEPSGAGMTTHVQTAATNAYARTLRPFHDWTLRNTAMVIIQSVPAFERIKSILLLIDDTAPSAGLIQPSAEALAQLQLDADRYAVALRRCLQVVHGMFLRLGLDPIFCPQTDVSAIGDDLKAAPPVS